MASVSLTSDAAQYGWQQLKLQMAQRNAEQAEQAAQTLRSQAAAAQRSADQARENARSLATEADRAEAQAGQARLGLAALRSAEQSFSRIADAVGNAAASQQAASAPAAAPVAPATPVASSASTTGSAPAADTPTPVKGATIDTTA